MPDDELSVDDVIRLAEGLMRREEWRRALGLMDTVPRKSRTFELWWTHGWALGKLEDWKAATRSLAHAVRMNPDSPIGLWALGVAHGQAGHPKLAERYLLAAITLKDSAFGRLTLAVHYMEQDKFAAAEKIHLEGIALKPRSRRRLEAYADFLWDVGRRDEARAMKRQARKLPKPAKRRRRSRVRSSASSRKTPRSRSLGRS